MSELNATSTNDGQPITMMSASELELMSELDLITSIFTNVNLISLILSVLLASFIGFTQLIKLRSAKRLSFRLYLWIGCSDILTHLPLHMDFVQDLTSCKVTNLIVSFSNFVSLLIVAVMALNLHLVFLLQKPSAVQSLKRYLAGVTLVAILLMIPSAVLTFVHDDACPFFTALPMPDAVWVLYATQGIPQLTLIVYCLYVFLATTIKLRMTLKKVLNFPKPMGQSGRGSRSSRGSRGIRGNCPSILSLREQHRMVGRLALYPLMPLITIVPYFVILALHPTINMHLPLSQAIQWFAASTQGSLNALFFLIDPSLPAVISELYRHWQSILGNLIIPAHHELPIINPTKFNEGLPTLRSLNSDYLTSSNSVQYPYLSETHRELL